MITRSLTKNRVPEVNDDLLDEVYLITLLSNEATENRRRTKIMVEIMRLLNQNINLVEEA